MYHLAQRKPSCSHADTNYTLLSTSTLSTYKLSYHFLPTYPWKYLPIYFCIPCQLTPFQNVLLYRTDVVLYSLELHNIHCSFSLGQNEAYSILVSQLSRIRVPSKTYLGIKITDGRSLHIYSILFNT